MEKRLPDLPRAELFEVCSYGCPGHRMVSGYTAGQMAQYAQAAIDAAAPVIAATAWAEGYASGVIDERTSDANIGIAGFGAKIDPARANPYLFSVPVAAAPVGWLPLIDARPQVVEGRQPIDGCTESNCKRCRTHPNHRGDMEHAGIGWRPGSPQVQP